MSNRMTKAQLVDENIRLRAAYEVLERQLREAQEQRQPVIAHNETKCEAAPFSMLNFEPSREGYYSYVNEKRAICKQLGKPISYKTFEQFKSFHAAQHGAH